MAKNEGPRSYSMLVFELAFTGFYRTVPTYHIEDKHMVTLPSGYFATSPHMGDVMAFVDFYWKSRLN